ncbi:TPA: hypothetical protein ACH3X2_012024 [Trebouxia sp. C0005]
MIWDDAPDADWDEAVHAYCAAAEAGLSALGTHTDARGDSLAAKPAIGQLHASMPLPAQTTQLQLLSPPVYGNLQLPSASLQHVQQQQQQQQQQQRQLSCSLPAADGLQADKQRSNAQAHKNDLTLQDIQHRARHFAQQMHLLPPLAPRHSRCPGVYSGQGCGAKLRWVQFREGGGCWGCSSWPACDYKEAATERLANPQVTLEAVSKDVFKVEAATGGEDVVRFCGGLTTVLAAAAIPLHKALSYADLPNAGHTTISQPAHAVSTSASRSSSSSSISGPRDNQLPLSEAADQKQNLAGQEQHASAAELGADMGQRGQVLFSFVDYDDICRRLQSRHLQPSLLGSSALIPYATLTSLRGGGRRASESEAEERFSSMPYHLRQALMPFQRAGVQFALRREGRTLLADEMGVGKTVQAIAIASCYREEWPLLIIVPASMRLVWAEELEKWLPHLRPSSIHVIEGKSDRLQGADLPAVCITSYEMMQRLTCDACKGIDGRPVVLTACAGSQHCLASKGWKIIIADESHTLRTSEKPPDARHTEAAVSAVRRSHRAIFLTGTPSLSRPFDLFRQVDALRPGLLGKDRAAFSYRYCGRRLIPVGRHGSNTKKYDNTGLSRAGELHALLKEELMLRRLKRDVMAELPPKRRQVVRLPRPKPADWPSQEVPEDAEDSGSEAEQDERQSSSRLRGSEAMSKSHQTGLAKLPNGLEWLINALGAARRGSKGRVESQGEGAEPAPKFLIFAHHKDVMSKLANALEGGQGKEGWGGVPYVRIDGETDSRDRRTACLQFKEDPSIRAALLSITAAGTGLDFSAASAVVFVELPQEVALVRQAEDRAHRHGQKLSVNVYFLVAKGTSDEHRWQALSRSLERVTAVHGDEGDDQHGLKVHEVHDMQPGVPISHRVDTASAAVGLLPLIPSSRSKSDDSIPGQGVPDESDLQSSTCAAELADAAGVLQTDMVDTALKLPVAVDMTLAVNNGAAVGQRGNAEADAGLQHAAPETASHGVIDRCSQEERQGVQPQLPEHHTSQLPGGDAGTKLQECSTMDKQPHSQQLELSLDQAEQVSPTQAQQLGLNLDSAEQVSLSQAGKADLAELHDLRPAGIHMDPAAEYPSHTGSKPGGCAQQLTSKSSALSGDTAQQPPAGPPAEPHAEAAQLAGGGAVGKEADGCEAAQALTQAEVIEAQTAGQEKPSVWFEVSPHTSRLHFHAAKDGSDPFGLSLPMGALQGTGVSASLQELLQAVDTRSASSVHVGPVGVLALPAHVTRPVLEVMLSDAREFVAEWLEMRPVFQHRLFGQCLRPPLQEMIEEVQQQATAEGAFGRGTSRYLDPARPDVQLPTGAAWSTVKVRYARFVNPVEYQQAFTADNGRLCICCLSPVPACSAKKAAVLEGAMDLFCGADCEGKFCTRSSGGALRRALFRLERGVCTCCGLDCHALVNKVRMIERGSHKCDERRRARILTYAPTFGRHGSKAYLDRLVKQAVEGNAWHADHIVAVYQGGGLCDLENLRTLCVICHQDVTKQQAKERAVARRQVAGQGTLDRFLSPSQEKQAQKHLAKVSKMPAKVSKNRQDLDMFQQGTKQALPPAMSKQPHGTAQQLQGRVKRPRRQMTRLYDDEPAQEIDLTSGAVGQRNGNLKDVTCLSGDDDEDFQPIKKAKGLSKIKAIAATLKTKAQPTADKQEGGLAGTNRSEVNVVPAVSFQSYSCSRGDSKQSKGRRVTVAAVDEAEVPLYPERHIRASAAIQDPLSWKGDLLAIGIHSDALTVKEGEATTINDSALQNLDKALDGVITEFIIAAEFTAKVGSSHTARVGGSARFISIVGLGKKDDASADADWGPSTYQKMGTAIGVAAKTHKAKTAAAFIVGSAPEPAAGRITQGAMLSAYEAVRFKKAQPKLTGGSWTSLEKLQVLLPEGGDVGRAQQSVNRSCAMAKGAIVTRYLVEAPPNICTPTHLANAAAKIAEGASDVMTLEVLEKEDCEKLQMGCYLAVAACSEEPLKFIHLTYKPKGPVKKKVALIGKGLTFDSGGYNLKVGGMIELMKFDMGGAGAVFGAAQIIADLKPEGVEIHFISASCENMIDGKGMLPGDVLTASNGKTVEVLNTDAEGRLTLADALVYAEKKCGAEAIIDVATLTGACMVALGTSMCGMFSPNQQLVSQLKQAGSKSGEKLWQLPLEDDYWENCKSPIADMTNIGGRFGGAITAALFLKEYVDSEKIPWAHLDIAGAAWDHIAHCLLRIMQQALVLRLWQNGLSAKGNKEGVRHRAFAATAVPVTYVSALLGVSV